MARPLWKELRHQRVRNRARTPLLPAERPRFGAAILSAIGALAAIVVGSSFGKYLHHPKTDTGGFVIVLTTAAAFVVLGFYSTRRFANQVGRLISSQGGRAAGSAVRLITTLVGLVIVVLAALGMLGVPVSRLLVGGAITGVVLGIAAQQSLGNVFAGLVLIIARPFTVGSHIRVRSGALGGVFDGEVTSIGLTYVVLETEDGSLYVPNLSMMAAGVMQLPDPAASKAASLYVNRGVPKRAPRHPPAAPRRSGDGARAVRLPREIVRSMRARRFAPSPGQPGAAPPPPSSASGAAPGAGDPPTSGSGPEPGSAAPPSARPGDAPGSGAQVPGSGPGSPPARGPFSSPGPAEEAGTSDPAPATGDREPQALPAMPPEKVAPQEKAAPPED